MGVSWSPVPPHRTSPPLGRRPPPFPGEGHHGSLARGLLDWNWPALDKCLKQQPGCSEDGFASCCLSPPTALLGFSWSPEEAATWLHSSSTTQGKDPLASWLKAQSPSSREASGLSGVTGSCTQSLTPQEAEAGAADPSVRGLQEVGQHRAVNEPGCPLSWPLSLLPPLPPK